MLSLVEIEEKSPSNKAQIRPINPLFLNAHAAFEY